MTERRLTRGVFRSAIETNAPIRACLDAHNADAKPFRWTAPADTIIGKRHRGKPPLESLHSIDASGDLTHIWPSSLHNRLIAPYAEAMSAALLAALLLSVAAYIHTRSAHPSMRPDNPIADLAWRGLSFAALITWGVLIVRGFAKGEWADAGAALIGSIALNWYFGHRGPRPTWPGLSMLFGVAGLGLATYSFLRE